MSSTSIDWHYDVEGEGDSVLFIHGWGVDRRVWRQQVKEISENYRVVSIDLPGHGKSSWINASLPAIAKDLNGLLVMLKTDTVHVVGSSLGGLLALQLYDFNPSLFKTLTFVGSMPKFASCESYPYGLDIKRMRNLGDQLENSYPTIVDIFFRSLFTPEERASRRFKWLQKFRQFDKKPMKQALVEYLDIMEETDLRETLRKTKVPVFFINGKGDEICTQETVAYIKTLLPQAEYYDFEKCGHFPFLSQPHEFNEVLLSFLKKNASC